MMLRVVAGSFVSAGVGVGVVSAGVQYVEKSMPVPDFTADGEKYDLNTFKGRWAKMMSQCDPATLLASEDMVRTAERNVAEFIKTGSSPLTSTELWDAKKLRDSAIHPDTKELIPQPFRMAGYVPFNGPVCVAMILSSSTPALLFWNWVNQSQNALVNYFNRNASSPTSNETLAKSYCGAVGVALVAAFGMSTFVNRRYSPEKAKQILKFSAFFSSMFASCSNCYIMRSPEIATGVKVSDKEGNLVANGARSSLAASKAVNETVMSRAMLQIPVFFIPAATMSLPPVVALCAANPAMTIPISTLVTMLAFGFGLPATVAYFPQIGSIETKDMEEAFHSDITGVETVYYNKGL